MRKAWMSMLLAVVYSLAIGAMFVVRADDDDDTLTLQAKLTGFNEVGAPVLAPNASNSTGTFHATLSPDGTRLNYKLTFTSFTSPIKFAHIHFAMPGVNGAVMVFLCSSTPGSPAPPTPTPPACVSPVTGTITAADIIAVPSQGITVNDFTDFLRVIRAGDGYANLHTNNFPGGEIRGQVKIVSDEDEGRDRK